MRLENTHGEKRRREARKDARKKVRAALKESVERTERSCGLARIRRGKPVVARGAVGRRCLIFLFF